MTYHCTHTAHAPRASSRAFWARDLKFEYSNFSYLKIHIPLVFIQFYSIEIFVFILRKCFNRNVLWLNSLLNLKQLKMVLELINKSRSKLSVMRILTCFISACQKTSFVLVYAGLIVFIVPSVLCKTGES